MTVQMFLFFFLFLALCFECTAAGLVSEEY